MEKLVAKETVKRLKEKFPYCGDATSPAGELRPEDVLEVVRIFNEVVKEQKHGSSKDDSLPSELVEQVQQTQIFLTGV